MASVTDLGDCYYRVILLETVNELAALKPISNVEQSHPIVLPSAPGNDGDSNSSQGQNPLSEEKSLILPSHRRLANYRKYISDHLDSTDGSKLDQRIHKQANRYKTRCRTFLEEIQEHCDRYESKSKIPGTVDADRYKMSEELDSVLQVLVQAAVELEKGNRGFLRELVEGEERKQNELKTCFERFYETRQMSARMDQEIGHAYNTMVDNLKQQQLELNALDRFTGEQEMNLAKEVSYANRSAEAALARLDKQWIQKIERVRKDLTSARERTVEEDQCNSKSSIHLHKSLEQTQVARRESKVLCDSDMEELRRQIVDLNEKIYLSEKKVQDAHKERELIKQFKLMFQSERERAQLEAEYRRKSRWAVLKLQAVWRGTMVRKGLGPFKHLRRRRRRSSGKRRKSSVKK